MEFMVQIEKFSGLLKLLRAACLIQPHSIQNMCEAQEGEGRKAPRTYKYRQYEHVNSVKCFLNTLLPFPGIVNICVLQIVPAVIHKHWELLSGQRGIHRSACVRKAGQTTQHLQGQNLKGKDIIRGLMKHPPRELAYYVASTFPLFSSQQRLRLPSQLLRNDACGFTTLARAIFDRSTKQSSLGTLASGSHAGCWHFSRRCIVLQFILYAFSHIHQPSPHPSQQKGGEGAKGIQLFL